MESKKKKLLKFLVVISTVFMLVLSMGITSFADGSILVPSSQGIYQVNGYAEPDILTVGGELPLYPEGSEIALEGYLSLSVGKHMNTTLTESELTSISNGGNIRYSENHQITLRKYASDYEYIITEENVNATFHNKYEAFRDTVRIESTLDNDFETAENILHPSIYMHFNELSLSESYCTKYNNASYIRIFSNVPIDYTARITAEVSQFNNVTGEMSYVTTTHNIDRLTSKEINGKYSATFSILGQMMNLKNTITSSKYFSVRDVKVSITPLSSDLSESIKVSTIRVSAPAFNYETPAINDVWNNQNEAYNWTNFTDWIQTAVTGFLRFEVMPNISLMGIMTVFIGFAVFVWFMKMFAGG